MIFQNSTSLVEYGYFLPTILNVTSFLNLSYHCRKFSDTKQIARCTLVSPFQLKQLRRLQYSLCRYIFVFVRSITYGKVIVTMDIKKLQLKADEWWSLKSSLDSNLEEVRIIVNDSLNYLRDYDPGKSKFPIELQ